MHWPLSLWPILLHRACVAIVAYATDQSTLSLRCVSGKAQLQKIAEKCEMTYIVTFLLKKMTEVPDGTCSYSQQL